LKAAGELAGARRFVGGGWGAGMVLFGSGCGGHGSRVWLKQILAEVGRLRVLGGGGGGGGGGGISRLR